MDSLPYKALIIDDEPPARQRMRQLLQDFDDVFTVVGEAVDGADGIQKIAELKPDIIFLDIQMPGITGFEMLQQIKEIPLVVFCTAYDTYSLQAFETNSLDYLVKPVRKERLAKTVEKLRFFKKENYSERLMDLLQRIDATSKKTKPTSVTVRNGKKITFVKLEDIVYFKASDKYVSLFTVKGKEYVTDLTLTELENQLTDGFLRIHRSILINKDKVKEVQPYFNSRYTIAMEDAFNTKLTSGRSYSSKIKEWIGV